jgi:hypothetical protein
MLSSSFSTGITNEIIFFLCIFLFI